MNPQRAAQIAKYKEMMKTYGKPMTITQGDPGAAARMAKRAFRAKLTMAEREALKKRDERGRV